jgi:hypothetical protein
MLPLDHLQSDAQVVEKGHREIVKQLVLGLDPAVHYATRHSHPAGLPDYD